MHVVGKIVFAVKALSGWIPTFGFDVDR